MKLPADDAQKRAIDQRFDSEADERASPGFECPHRSVPPWLPCPALIRRAPLYAEIGEEVRPDTDQLFVVVDGVGEARVGDRHLAVHEGDLIHVPAGTRHNIVNRATLPLRLIAVLVPPAYAPGTVVEALPTPAPRPAGPWQPFG